MALEPAELRRRVRAARALAAPTQAEIDIRLQTRDAKRRGDLEDGISTAELAERLAAAGYDGLKKDTLSAIERGVRALRRQDLEAIAAACSVPYEFFTFELADLHALRNQIAHIQPLSEGGTDNLDNLVVVMAHLNERLAAIEGELGLRDVARAENQALTAALDRAGEAGHPAVRRTRDGEDASAESDEAPSRETPSSVEPPAR